MQAGKRGSSFLWGLQAGEISCSLEGGRTVLKTLYLQGRKERDQLGPHKQAQVQWGDTDPALPGLLCLSPRLCLGLEPRYTDVLEQRILSLCMDPSATNQDSSGVQLDTPRNQHWAQHRFISS